MHAGARQDLTTSPLLNSSTRGPREWCKWQSKAAWLCVQAAPHLMLGCDHQRLEIPAPRPCLARSQNIWEKIILGVPLGAIAPGKFLVICLMQQVLSCWETQNTHGNPVLLGRMLNRSAGERLHLNNQPTKGLLHPPDTGRVCSYSHVTKRAGEAAPFARTEGEAAARARECRLTPYHRPLDSWRARGSH